MDYHFSPAPEEKEPYWTPRRIVFIIVTLITLLAFLFYVLIVPLIEANTEPSPPLTPTVLPRF